jgi:hypothetical protein
LLQRLYRIMDRPHFVQTVFLCQVILTLVFIITAVYVNAQRAADDQRHTQLQIAQAREISASNHTLLENARETAMQTHHDLLVHAEATRERSCATVHVLEALADQVGIDTAGAPYRRLVTQACKIQRP